MGLAAKAAFVDGLDCVLLVAAVVAFVAGVTALFTIRPKDFIHYA